MRSYIWRLWLKPSPIKMPQNACLLLIKLSLYGEVEYKYHTQEWTLSSPAHFWLVMLFGWFTDTGWFPSTTRGPGQFPRLGCVWSTDLQEAPGRCICQLGPKMAALYGANRGMAEQIRPPWQNDLKMLATMSTEDNLWVRVCQIGPVTLHQQSSH